MHSRFSSRLDPSSVNPAFHLVLRDLFSSRFTYDINQRGYHHGLTHTHTHTHELTGKKYLKRRTALTLNDQETIVRKSTVTVAQVISGSGLLPVLADMEILRGPSGRLYRLRFL